LRPERPKFAAVFLAMGSEPPARQLESLGSAVSSPAGFGWSPDRKCILDALRAEKTRLVAANVV